MKKKHILALVLFMLLPLLFPCGGRGYMILPFVDRFFFFPEDPGLHFWFAFIAFFFSLPYWAFVGYMFRRFGVAPLKSFLLGNIPVFFNGVGELLYFFVLKIHPPVYDYGFTEYTAYLLGSHIDKFQLFPEYAPLPSVLFSIFAFLVAFLGGYHWDFIRDKLAGLFIPYRKTS